MATTRLMTIEEFETLPDDGKRYELLCGELIEMPPPGEDHSDASRELLWRIENFIRPLNIEKLFIETTFVLEPKEQTALIPDLAFVVVTRLDPNRDSQRIVFLAPDLAVEIASPTNYPAEIARKVATYLRTGVRLVWIVDPIRRTVAVHRHGGEPAVLRGTDILSGEDIIPGFVLPVNEIFRRRM